MIRFKNNKSNSSEASSSSPSSSTSPSFKIDFRLEQISLLIGNTSSQILYIQLKDFNGYLSKTDLRGCSQIVSSPSMISKMSWSTCYYVTHKDK